MLVPSFDTFYEQAEALFRAEPLRVRLPCPRRIEGRCERRRPHRGGHEGGRMCSAGVLLTRLHPWLA
jgi:hypothetical protein